MALIINSVSKVSSVVIKYAPTAAEYAGRAYSLFHSHNEFDKAEAELCQNPESLSSSLNTSMHAVDFMVQAASFFSSNPSVQSCARGIVAGNITRAVINTGVSTVASKLKDQTNAQAAKEEEATKQAQAAAAKKEEETKQAQAAAAKAEEARKKAKAAADQQLTKEFEGLENWKSLDHIPATLANLRLNGEFVFKRCCFSDVPIRNVVVSKFDPKIICEKNEVDKRIKNRIVPAKWPADKVPMCWEHFMESPVLQKEIDDKLAEFQPTKRGNLDSEASKKQNSEEGHVQEEPVPARKNENMCQKFLEFIGHYIE